MVKLVTDWLVKEIGGLDKMYAINCRKAAMLYDAIDQSGGFYQAHAEADSRSIMNIPFRRPYGLRRGRSSSKRPSVGWSSSKGHRSVGGCRARSTTPCPRKASRSCGNFMVEFAKKNK